MKKVIGICRYSVITLENKKDWEAGKKSTWEEYQKNVLNPDSLDKKLILFNGLTLPSLELSLELENNVDFIFLILISKYMPKEQLFNLKEVIKKYSWCKIIELDKEDTIKESVNNELLNIVDKNEIYATFRLDDDDALNKEFFKSLVHYVGEKFINHAISYPAGVNALFSYEDKKYLMFSNTWHRNIGLGLSLISTIDMEHKHILYDKRHLNIDLRHPTIVISTKYPMFIRTVHENSDLMNRNKNRINSYIKNNQDNIVEYEQIKDYFRLDSSLTQATDNNTKIIYEFKIPNNFEMYLKKQWIYKNKVRVFDFQYNNLRFAIDIQVLNSDIIVDLVDRDEKIIKNIEKSDFYIIDNKKLRYRNYVSDLNELNEAIDKILKSIIEVK